MFIDSSDRFNTKAGEKVCMGASEAPSWDRVFQDYIRKQKLGDMGRRREGGMPCFLDL